MPTVNALSHRTQHKLAAKQLEATHASRGTRPTRIDYAVARATVAATRRAEQRQARTAAAVSQRRESKARRFLRAITSHGTRTRSPRA